MPEDGGIKERFFRWIVVPLFWIGVGFGLWSFQVEPFYSLFNWIIGFIQANAGTLIDRVSK